MADLNEIRQQIYKIADENADYYNSICDEIFRHPELGNREFYSSKFLASEMEKRGFRVEYPYGGLATAFRCEIGSGHPKIAFLAEYDALPGYGPNKDQNGHACGHNWIASSSFGAADVLAKLADQLPGTIVYIGTPAEESVGGKIDLVNAGCFEDIDAVFQMHLSTRQTRLRGATLAMDSVEFTFEGKAAHAAGNPWDGINALDACYLTFDGINALRQHMKPDARVHGIIEEGGVAPNIVPNHCVAKFYIRAAEREYVNSLTEKVINCARGAELMTGAKMSWRFFENPFDNLKVNDVLTDIMAENLDRLGIEYDAAPEAPSGSSDLGNVSKVCPTCYVSFDVGNTDGFSCHAEEYLKYVNAPEYGWDRNIKAIKAMAASAAEVFLSPEIQEQIKK